LPYLLFEDGSAALLEGGGGLLLEQFSAPAPLLPGMTRAHYLLLVVPPVLAAPAGAGFFEADLLAYLNGLGLVAFAGQVPEGEPLPAITFARVGADRPTQLSGGSGLVDTRCQLAAYSTDYLDCQRISEALRAVLHGFRGMMGGTEIRPALLLDQVYTFEQNVDATGRGTHGIVNDYLFCFRETILQPRG